jgi:hypothetical protein
MNTGDRVKQYNEQLGDFFCYSPNISRGIKWKDGMWHEWGRTEEHIIFLVGKPEGKGALVRPRRRWDGNMKRIQDRIRKLGVD